MSYLDGPGEVVRRLLRHSWDEEQDVPPSPVAPCPLQEPTPRKPPRPPRGADEELDWIEVVLVDPAGQPAVGISWRITTADGVIHEGVLDETGTVFLDNIVPGEAVITFPDLDHRLWEPD